MKDSITININPRKIKEFLKDFTIATAHFTVWASIKLFKYSVKFVKFFKIRKIYTNQSITKQKANKAHNIFVIMLCGLLFVGIGIGLEHKNPSYDNPSANVTNIRSQHQLHTKKGVIVDVKNPKMAQIRTDASVKQKKGFINQIGYGAMKAFQHKQNYQVLPSIVIAQAIIESDWGQSGLYTQAHNVFGVKGQYKGKSVNMPTEEDNGGAHIVHADFRKYPSVEASVLDHNYLLQHVFIRKSHDMNYKQVAKLIKANDYATDPNYAYKLIGTIQKYHLYRYDKMALK